jgi:hypothetical protein
MTAGAAIDEESALMASARERPGWGIWLLFIAAVIAVLVSLYDFLLAWGINHTLGSGIVLAAIAIMALAALTILAWAAMPRWLRVLLLIGLALDVLGTGLAAYFLTAWVLLALMVVAAIAWVATAFSGVTPSREQVA